jgi:hypothetical protein
LPSCHQIVVESSHVHLTSERSHLASWEGTITKTFGAISGGVATTHKPSPPSKVRVTIKPLQSQKVIGAYILHEASEHNKTLPVFHPALNSFCQLISSGLSDSPHYVACTINGFDCAKYTMDVCLDSLLHRQLIQHIEAEDLYRRFADRTAESGTLIASKCSTLFDHACALMAASRLSARSQIRTGLHCNGRRRR